MGFRPRSVLDPAVVRRRLNAMFGVMLVAASACATDNGGVPDDPAEDQSLNSSGELNRGELPVAVRFQRTAEGNWLKGNEAFDDEEYLAAQRYFQYIRTKFPYSRFAALAEVRIGDCQFERERYLEAIDTYQGFVRTQPTHPSVPYATYRVGLAYYEQIPGDFFMLPPSHEKDQTAVRDAERRLAEYVRRFPKDENAADAQAKLDEVRRRLMDHERYVADFYKRLDRGRAYVGRLEVIRREFPDVGLSDELLFEITEAWAKVGELEKAKDAAEQLAADFPKSRRLDEARALVAAAQQKAEAEAASEGESAEDDALQPATESSDG